MTDLLRLAGRGHLPDSTDLLWSVAEGRRGRRWRSTTLAQGAIVLDLLLELDHDGSFTRLELTSPAGMLTLHPGAGGTRVLGNVVAGDGVRPIDLPWQASDGLRVAASPLAEVLLRPRETTPGGLRWIIEVDHALGVQRRPHVPGQAPSAGLDERGVPVLEDAEEWPLEV